MKAHFVTFYSPGTFVHEETTKPIDKWDVDMAVKMAAKVTERYDSRPFGFQFSTRERKAKEVDSRVTTRSSMYYLGGTVETLAEVKARATKDDRILVQNMEGNGWDRVVTTNTPWRCIQPLLKGDIVLPRMAQK